MRLPIDIGQPVTALPTSITGTPWAATRERLQRQGSAPPTPLIQQHGLSSASSGLLSPSGACSAVLGVACSAYASPSPFTPHASLYPNTQTLYLFTAG